MDSFFEKLGEIKAELWIGKKDFFLYRFKLVKEIDLEKFGEEGKFNIEITVNLSKFNQPIKIEPPEEFKTIEELFSEKKDEIFAPIK